MYLTSPLGSPLRITDLRKRYKQTVICRERDSTRISESVYPEYGPESCLQVFDIYAADQMKIERLAGGSALQPRVDTGRNMQHTNNRAMSLHRGRHDSRADARPVKRLESRPYRRLLTNGGDLCNDSYHIRSKHSNSQEALEVFKQQQHSQHSSESAGWLSRVSSVFSRHTKAHGIAIAIDHAANQYNACRYRNSFCASGGPPQNM